MAHQFLVFFHSESWTICWNIQPQIDGFGFGELFNRNYHQVSLVVSVVRDWGLVPIELIQISLNFNGAVTFQGIGVNSGCIRLTCGARDLSDTNGQWRLVLHH